MPNSKNISWTDSTLEAEVMVGAEEPGGRLLPPAWWPACWLTGPLLNPLRTLELSPQTLVASDRQSGCPPPCCCCCCCCCEVTWDWFWDWITWKSKYLDSLVSVVSISAFFSQKKKQFSRKFQLFFNFFPIFFQFFYNVFCTINRRHRTWNGKY